jgi:hypothetical protein
MYLKKWVDMGDYRDSNVNWMVTSPKCKIYTLDIQVCFDFSFEDKLTFCAIVNLTISRKK